MVFFWGGIFWGVIVWKWVCFLWLWCSALLLGGDSVLQSCILIYLLYYILNFCYYRAKTLGPYMAQQNEDQKQGKKRGKSIKKQGSWNQKNKEKYVTKKNKETKKTRKGRTGLWRLGTSALTHMILRENQTTERK